MIDARIPALADALRAIVLTPSTHLYLSEHDPKALFQALAALAAIEPAPPAPTTYGQTVVLMHAPTGCELHILHRATCTATPTVTHTPRAGGLDSFTVACSCQPAARFLKIIPPTRSLVQLNA